MNEIKFSVDEKNLEIVLTILNNLKIGLIADIQINGKRSKMKNTKYRPKVNTIIREEESGTADRSGKYINPEVYKQRLKK